MRVKQHLAFCLLCVIAMCGVAASALYIMPALVQDAACVCIACAEVNSCDATCQALACGSSVISIGTQNTLAEFRKVDLNNATREQLCMLSGIGEKKATYIMEYRLLVGAFDSVQDVANVSGVTETMVESWGDQVYVSPMK